MKRTATIAGLTGFALGFALAIAGLPPRAGAQPHQDQAGGGHAAVYGTTEGGNDVGGDGATVPRRRTAARMR